MRRISTLLIIVSISCSSAREQTPDSFSADQARPIADSVRQMMHEYSASFGKETCENQEPVLKFFDWSGDGVIDATESTITEYKGDAWPKLIRDAACSRVTEKAGIDSLFVRMLTRDIAVVNWTFHSEYVQRNGPPQFARGAVMQVFQRTPTGWKTSVGMSTHQPIPAK